MPIIQGKSKQSFKKNVEAEMDAGKPKDQSLAIAYSVQRKNKRKKMAEGGAISASDEQRPSPDSEYNDSKDISQNSGKKPLQDADWDSREPEKAASMSSDPYSDQSDDYHSHYESIADAILAKKQKAARFAEGGEVDLEANSEESPNMADEDNYDAIKKEQYDDSQISPQPEDSNEHGHDINSDVHDMVDAIRLKMRTKRGF